MIRPDDLFEEMELYSGDLPVIFHKDYLGTKRGYSEFRLHWHEKIEFLYFLKGKAVISCGNKKIEAGRGDLVVINSNELHSGRVCGKECEYYCMIVGNSLFLNRRIDNCETKYIQPIYENYILFENIIKDDTGIGRIINRIASEYDNKETGYELAIKSYVYGLLTILLRKYSKRSINQKEYMNRMENARRLNSVLDYIDGNYSDNITIDELSRLVNLSRYRFCHLFKELTGKTPVEYVNMVRVEKASELLERSGMNVSEISSVCGFNDPGYFGRVFRKYKSCSPSDIIKIRYQG